MGREKGMQKFCRESSRLFKVLSNPVRLEIICQILCRDKVCVKDLTELLGRKQANISQHLAILRNMGMVDFHRRDNAVLYFIKDKNLERFLEGFATRELEGERGQGSRTQTIAPEASTVTASR